MTRDQAVERLLSAQIVCGAIRSLDDIAEDKDVIASGVLVDVAGADGASFTSPGLAFTLDGRRRTTSVAAPATGQHTAAVLHELGYTDEEVAGLLGRGVIGDSAPN
jgi:crotonobetainyl-CoA:carnitine CoA-transferase CaiB-like acyl-CoA transferase